MKTAPPKNIIITHATINHTHHGVPVEFDTMAIGGVDEPPVVEPGIFAPPEMS